MDLDWWSRSPMATFGLTACDAVMHLRTTNVDVLVFMLMLVFCVFMFRVVHVCEMYGLDWTKQVMLGRITTTHA
jgi:hypothetical protein